MGAWHLFQGTVWIAVMAAMVQWHSAEYGEPVNPMVAFVAGGLAAYYGTGLMQLFIYLLFGRGRDSHRSE